MTLLNTFREQPFHLALSSGFFGFYAHVGFLKAIYEFDLNPSSYSGSSAGAIVAAAAAKGLSIKEIENLITGVSRKDFWDPSIGLGLLRGQKLQTLLEREIGFDFNSLTRPMRIPVFDIVTQKTHVFTSGNLAQVIRASCSVPILFHPVKIDRRLYWDGGIADKMAVHGIANDKKILIHYLESTSRDPHSIYELKRDQQAATKRGNNLLLIQLKKLSRANPFTMYRGPEIIEAAYRQTKSILQSHS